MEVFQLLGRMGLEGKRKINRGIDDVQENVEDANESFKDLNSSAGKFGKTMQRVGTWAKRATAVGSAAIAGLATNGLRNFASFQEGMKEVYTLIPDASEEMKEELMEDIKDVGEEYGYLSEKTVPALYQALSAGVPPENVISFIETAAKGATAGATDLQTSVDALTSVVNAYGAGVIDAQEASDTLFTIIKEGKTRLPELSDQLGEVTPLAASLGIQFEDIGAAIATMSKQGLPTNKVMTQLAVILEEISDPASTTFKAFEKASGKTLPEFIEEGGRLNEVLQILSKYAEESDMNIRELFDSAEAGKAVLMLTGNSMEIFNESIDAMGDKTGSTQTAFEEMASGIQHTIDQIKAWWNNTNIDIGASLQDPLEDLLVWLQSNSDSIENTLTAIFSGMVDGLRWLKKNKEETVTAVKTIGAAFLGWKVAGLATNVWSLAAALTAVTGIAISDYIKDMKEYGDFRGEVGEEFQDAQETWSNLNSIQKRTLSNYRSVVQELESAQKESVNLTDKEIDRLEDQKEFLRDRLEALNVTTETVQKFVDTEEDFAEGVSETEKDSAELATTLYEVKKNLDLLEEGTFSLNRGLDDTNKNIRHLGKSTKEQTKDTRRHAEAVFDAETGYARYINKLKEYRERQTDVTEEEAQAIKLKRETLEAIEEEIQLQKDLGNEYNATQIKVNKFSDLLRKMHDEGLRGTFVYKELMATLGDLKSKTDELEVSWEGFNQELASNLSSTLTNIITDFENFGDYIDNFFENLTRNVIRRYTDVWAQQIVNATTSGNFGGGGGGGGIDWGSLIQTGVSWFASAQEGLKTNGETIVQVGDNPSGEEVVIPLEQSVFSQLARNITQAMGEQGGGTSIGDVHVYQVEGMSDRAFVDGVQRNADSVKAQIIDAVRNNEGLRKQLRRLLT